MSGWKCLKICDRGDNTPNISDVGEDVDGGDDTQHVTAVCF